MLNISVQITRKEAAEKYNMTVNEFIVLSRRRDFPKPSKVLMPNRHYALAFNKDEIAKWMSDNKVLPKVDGLHLEFYRIMAKNEQRTKFKQRSGSRSA